MRAHPEILRRFPPRSGGLHALSGDFADMRVLRWRRLVRGYTVIRASGDAGFHRNAPAGESRRPPSQVRLVTRSHHERITPSPAVRGERPTCSSRVSTRLDRRLNARGVAGRHLPSARGTASRHCARASHHLGPRAERHVKKRHTDHALVTGRGRRLTIAITPTLSRHVESTMTYRVCR